MRLVTIRRVNPPESQSSSPARPGYQFADVRVDATRRQLFVHGREVRCRPLSFELLLLLCEAGGAVVSREEVFARLWGEAYVPSDESLTQIVHRLRSALRESGKAVRTVRGVGLRLDAPVVAVAPEAAPGNAPDLSTRPEPFPVESPAPPAHPRLEPRRRRWLAAGLIAALLLGVCGIAAWRTGRSTPIDPGFALWASDLGSSSAQTEDLMRRALAAEGRGDRAQALELLETAHRSDPATPAPAIFIGFWSSHDAAVRWSALAERRLTRDSSPYLQLLARFIREDAQGSGSAEGTLSALLNLRQDAWRLRLARAHYYLSWHRDEAALADLRRIPVRALTHRGLAIVLADRASLGDLEGAERDFRSGLLEGEEALSWYVRGRLERSRGRAAEAREAFDRTVAEAARRNQPDLQIARLLAAAASFEAGNAADAAQRLDDTVDELRDLGRPEWTTDALGLGAYLAWRRGDFAGRDRRLAEASQLVGSEDLLRRTALVLLAGWTGGTPGEAPEHLAATLAAAPDYLGAHALLLARGAFAQGRPEEAVRLLEQARAEGVGLTYLSEQADLLARHLGAAVPVPRVDPPYPNLLRLTAAWEIERLRQSAR